jgi:hypothetical protein
MAENANEWHQQFCPLLGLHKSIGAKFVVIRDLHGPNTQATIIKSECLVAFLFFFSIMTALKKRFREIC